MINTKKAQIESQIFIYIMVIVVASGILIFGYRAIQGFKESADDVLYNQFEVTIKNDLKAISFESVKVKTYELPTKITSVCFKALGAVYADVTAQDPKKLLIANAIGPDGKGTQNDVFLYPNGQKAFFSGVNIALGDSKFKCFDVKGGALKIRIEGRGSSVLITE